MLTWAGGIKTPHAANIVILSKDLLLLSPKCAHTHNDDVLLDQDGGKRDYLEHFNTSEVV